MKVLHVLNTGHRNFGGKERATLDLVCGLREAGVDAQLVCLRSGLTDALAARLGIPVHVPEARSPENIGLVFAVRRCIEAGGFDLVHTHDFRENAIGRLAARLAGVPVVTTVHGLARLCFDMPVLKRYAYHALDLLTARMSKRFIVLSEADRGILGAAVPSDLVSVIPVALKPPKIAGRRKRSTGEPMVFGAAGRLDRQKGFDILVRAAADLLKGGADARFVLAGTGPRERELKALIGDLGIADRFELLGFVEDMDGFFGAIDVFVLPSRTERRPLALMEALARGVFAIAADVGAVGEMIEDGRTGLLVPPDDPDALARAMREVVRQPSLLELAEPGRADLEAAFDRMVARTIDIYREVLRAGRA